MNRVSRRALARYAVDQLLAGQSAEAVSRQLAATLSESGMTNELEFLVGDIAWELERRGELAIATVTTASPLPRELARQLTEQVRKAIGSKEVLLEERVDKSVIGGVRVETSAKIWDATVTQKLARIREAF